jgi:hypothetical protein
MSHFSRIKTQMVEKEYLLLALKDAGYSCEEGEHLHVRGYGGKQTPVDIKVSAKKFLSYAIGFRKNGKTYECIADWWGVRGIKQQQFMQQITQRYAYHAARAKLEAQGFSLVSEEVQEGDQIHLRLRRMA